MTTCLNLYRWPSESLRYRRPHALHNLCVNTTKHGGTTPHRQSGTPAEPEIFLQINAQAGWGAYDGLPSLPDRHCLVLVVPHMAQVRSADARPLLAIAGPTELTSFFLLSVRTLGPFLPAAVAAFRAEGE